MALCHLWNAVRHDALAALCTPRPPRRIQTPAFTLGYRPLVSPTSSRYEDSYRNGTATSRRLFDTANSFPSALSGRQSGRSRTHQNRWSYSGFSISSERNIVLWLDDTSIVELTPVKTEAPAFETIVRGIDEPTREQATNVLQSCWGCHSASSYGTNKNTPNLWGIYGRKIAGTTFSAYSQALQSKSGPWNDKTLDAFLEDTKRFAPGTTMAYPGISSPAIRKVVIEYLKALKEE